MLSEGEVALLDDGLTDDVAFVWVLIHLGLRGNPPTANRPPTPDEVDEALRVLARMSAAGFVRVGRTEYVDGGPPGRRAPVRHVEEPMDVVAERVHAHCAEGPDSGWEWSCWVVNTDAGDALVRQDPERRPRR